MLRVLRHAPRLRRSAAQDEVGCWWHSQKFSHPERSRSEQSKDARRRTIRRYHLPRAGLSRL